MGKDVFILHRHMNKIYNISINLPYSLRYYPRIQIQFENIDKIIIVSITIDVSKTLYKIMNQPS